MTKARRQEPEGFAEFWDIWRPHMRHTDGRGDARKAFHKHIEEGADPQEIIDGAKAFLRSLTDRDKPYIPLAASWLNKEAYSDWAERERQYQEYLASKGSDNVVNMPAQGKRSRFMELWDAGKIQTGSK
jgi:hypothetical protein